MVDVDYYSFRQLLKEATDRGGRIETRDTERWNTYIKTHKLNATAARAIAATRFDSPDSVIIDLGGDRDGLYVYSDLEEGCLHLEYQS